MRKINNRPMDHITHLKNNFNQWTNLHKTNSLIHWYREKKINISFLRIEWSFVKFWAPFTQVCFVLSLVETGLVKILKFCQCICLISLFSPIGIRFSHWFELTWIPITQEHFVPSLVEIDSVILEKKMNMWKVYRQMEKQIDDRQSEKLS